MERKSKLYGLFLNKINTVKVGGWATQELAILGDSKEEIIDYARSMEIDKRYHIVGQQNVIREYKIGSPLSNFFKPTEYYKNIREIQTIDEFVKLHSDYSYSIENCEYDFVCTINLFNKEKGYVEPVKELQSNSRKETRDNFLKCMDNGSSILDDYEVTDDNRCNPDDYIVCYENNDQYKNLNLKYLSEIYLKPHVKTVKDYSCENDECVVFSFPMLLEPNLVEMALDARPKTIPFEVLICRSFEEGFKILKELDEKVFSNKDFPKEELKSLSRFYSILEELDIQGDISIEEFSELTLNSNFATIYKVDRLPLNDLEDILTIEEIRKEISMVLDK